MSSHIGIWIKTGPVGLGQVFLKKWCLNWDLKDQQTFVREEGKTGKLFLAQVSTFLQRSQNVVVLWVWCRNLKKCIVGWVRGMGTAVGRNQIKHGLVNCFKSFHGWVPSTTSRKSEPCSWLSEFSGHLDSASSFILYRQVGGAIKLPSIFSALDISFFPSYQISLTPLLFIRTRLSALLFHFSPSPSRPQLWSMTFSRPSKSESARLVLWYQQSEEVPPILHH